MGTPAESSTISSIRALASAPAEGAWAALGVGLLALLFLAVALWNGFPLIFYDTGAYVLEGLGHVFLVERAPVYAELLFLAGGAYSLWPIVAFQALLSAYVILEAARAEVPGLTLGQLLGIGAILTLLTGMAWYVGQVEPDCLTPLVVLGSWMLLFRQDRLGRWRSIVMILITGLAVACHPSHLGLICGLVLAAGLLKLVVLWRRRKRQETALPDPCMHGGLAGLGVALVLIVAGNFAMTGSFFLSKSGSVFVFARLMQDGIVKKLLDDTCPPEGNATYRLCNYKNRLKYRADAWLWGDSSFRSLGGFSGRQQQEEDRQMILDSLRRYPFLHVRAAIDDSVRQMLMFRTGDGIEPQEWVLEPEFKRMIPRQLNAYLGARQQKGLLRFHTLNLVHVPVGAISVLGLLLLIQHSWVLRRWDRGTLPALVLLALMGNAIICGTFSNPHDRYQSRVIWLPTLVLVLALARDRRALQPVPDI
ncbi:MAG: hypothetical protein BGN85_10560 [Alphaproteobacteria bacterium 64-11]|nr:hypothetical protein [Alphaproteobacteria bacterium]OJU11546.1 MAG: hypothetical protein BGN85_10560 [Alphaproteobacteria bacterium 64-11]